MAELSAAQQEILQINHAYTFLDFPSGHAATRAVPDYHHADCSSSGPFICDCAGIKMAQWAWEECSRRWEAALIGILENEKP